MTDALSEQLDKTRISEVYHRYCAGVDLRDWALYRQCFTDDLIAEFKGLTDPATFEGADLYVEMVKKAVGGFQATQHFSTNHHHVVHGDEATSNAYVTAQHVFVNPLGDNENLIGGFYHNHFVRTDEGWRIDKLQLNLTWSKGNRHIYQLAAKALSG